MAPPQLSRFPQKPRQPLRERCQVALTIIPISYRRWNALFNCNYGLVLVLEEEKEKGNQEQHTPPPSPTPSLTEESHLVEIIEGLYVAMVDDEADVPSLRTFDDQPFTHVVQVRYVTPSENDQSVLSNWRREETPRNALVQRLDLLCPADSLQLCAEQMAVGGMELKAARDFLSLALPHGSKKWWPEELRKDEQGNQRGRYRHEQYNEQDDDDDDEAQFAILAPHYGLDEFLYKQYDRVQKQDDEVNVLIVAPTCRAVDVLSVLVCYLAFLEDIEPKNLVNRKFCDEAWQIAMCPLSLVCVDLIAKCN